MLNFNIISGLNKRGLIGILSLGEASISIASKYRGYLSTDISNQNSQGAAIPKIITPQVGEKKNKNNNRKVERRE